MDPAFTIFTLSTIPYFSSRICGSVFWVALLARLQSEGLLEPIQKFGFLRIDLELFFPEWFIDPVTLSVFGVLALLEVYAEKNPDLAVLFRFFDSEVKGAGHFLLTEVVSIQGAVAVMVSLSYRQAGWGPSLIVSLFAGAAVWLIAGVRSRIMDSLTEMDDGDDLGIRKWLSWLEDLWVGFGMVFIIVLPAVALVISGITVLALVLVQRYLKAREAKNREACPECGVPTHRSAFKCPGCGHNRAAVSRIGYLGTPKKELVGDPEGHHLFLLFRKRCTVCAERLPKKALVQDCAACGNRVFPDPESVDDYLKHLQMKLPKILAVSFGLSLIPLFGLIPGIIYYKLSLISGMRSYLPIASGCLTRWLSRLATILLLAFQWVPIIGGLSLPLLCLLHYAIYRQALIREKKSIFKSRP